MAEEKIYERVEAAEKIACTLCEKYPEILWRVRPDRVAVLGISNKERSEKCKDLMKVTPIKGVNKAIAQIYKVPISFIIELYWSDWNVWTDTYKEWIIMKALLMIGEEDGKIIKPDCVEFRLILDVVGLDWEGRDDLPMLTSGEVKFDKDLRPGMDDLEEDENNGNEEEDKKIEGENFKLT